MKSNLNSKHRLAGCITRRAISPNVLELLNLTYAISLFLAEIIPVPISPKVPNIAEFA